MKALVIGGTGVTGSEAVRILLERGVPVRVATRSLDKAARLPSGAEPAIADLRDPDSLRTLFTGIDAAFIVTALSPHETQEGIAAVNGAKLGGIGHITYMSVHRADQAPHIPHFQSKLPVEQAVRESGIRFTILRPNHFFQNDLASRIAIVNDGVYPQPLGKIGFSRVDVRDIAEAAANTLLEPGHDGKVYPVVGPEVLNGEKVAEIYTRHLGRPVRYSGDDLEAWAEQARQVMPEWFVRDARVMFEYFQNKGLAATPEEVEETERLLGRPPRRFEDFVSEIAQAWRIETPPARV